MAITTDKNTNYGPPLVNQKYAPLASITFANADRPIYTGMLNNRMTMLRSAGLIGQQLEITVPNWNNVVAAEAGHLPPLVVISSNRAAWIVKGFTIADAQLASYNIAAFTNASDLRALTDLNNSLDAHAAQYASPPLYTPSRIGANRNVYIVVNIAEYSTYKRALADYRATLTPLQQAAFNVTPVGWNFAKRAGARRNLAMVGFGATRFAAMQFCKSLRRAAAAAAPGGVAPWNSAWLIDDNTVAMTNFAGFAAVEGALGARACAGFRGGTSALAASENKTWARAELQAGRGTQAGALPASAPPGIIQQTALWNIQYFDTNFLNFGPLYITSAEDLSITNYFNNAAIPYLYYDGIGVRKEDPTYDNKVGAQKVNRARQELASWVTAAESTDPPNQTAPPPINVQPVNGADGGQQTLSLFITNRVLPNASDAIRALRDNVATQAQAKCQGVEQLTCGALNVGYVDNAAVLATFKINGLNQQVVQTRNVP
jgi:hypothetical protein